jgi:hypothetical protein
MNNFRGFIGILCVVLGFLIMFGGGISLLIYSVLDIASHWDSLTPMLLTRDLIFFLLRDVLAVGLGIIFLLIGGAIYKT